MTNQTPESVIAEALSSAGAPLMHSRVEEGVASALRAANMLREPGVPDAATEELARVKSRAEDVAEDEGWHIGGAWGDYGEVVVPLRILSYVIDGKLDEKIVSTDPGYAATYAEQTARAEKAEAERDTALAAIERVRARLGDILPDWSDSGVIAVADILAALDGAPEPEWEYQWGEPGESFEGFDSFETYDEALAEMRDQSEYSSHRVMRRRKAGPWEVCNE